MSELPEIGPDAPETNGQREEEPRQPAALVPRPLPPTLAPLPIGSLPVGLLRLGRRARELSQNPVAVAAASAAATAAATVATTVAVGVVRRALGGSGAVTPSIAPPEVLLRGIVRHEVHVVHHVVRTVHVVQTVQRTSLPGGPLPPIG